MSNSDVPKNPAKKYGKGEPRETLQDPFLPTEMEMPNHPKCQVDNCKKDLSLSADYHRLNEVCEVHTNATTALVEEQIQRFCQFCLRFHLLSAFDGESRICIRECLPSEDSDSRGQDTSYSLSQDSEDLKIVSVPAASKSSRRVPPRCWSFEETVALIDAYRDKWYALHRENLTTNHWEEVAEAVAAKCPDVKLKKTGVQCRNKMGGLRTKYCTEIERARSVPMGRFISSWVHFERMEAMEHRPETKRGNEFGEEESSVARTTPRFFNRDGTAGSGGGGGSIIRIRIPTGVSKAQPGPRLPGKIDQKYMGSPSPGMSSNPRPGKRARVVRIPEGGGEERAAGKRGREMMMSTEDEDDDEPMVEIESAVKLLGDTMLRTEQTKMEMTREMEAMRIEAETNRKEMILESQQRLVEAFAKSMSDNTEEEKTKTNDDDPKVEIASAIKLLGDTMLITEQTKMATAREIEKMMLETEMKGTQMILESQQRLVEAFAKSMSEKKKKKKKAKRICL